MLSHNEQIKLKDEQSDQSVVMQLVMTTETVVNHLLDISPNNQQTASINYQR